MEKTCELQYELQGAGEGQGRTPPKAAKGMPNPLALNLHAAPIGICFAPPAIRVPSIVDRSYRVGIKLADRYQWHTYC